MTLPIPEYRLHRCANPPCFRKVKEGVDFCCQGCRRAHDGKFDADTYHSGGCQERLAERGMYPVVHDEPWLPTTTSRGSIVGGGTKVPPEPPTGTAPTAVPSPGPENPPPADPAPASALSGVTPAPDRSGGAA